MILVVHFGTIHRFSVLLLKCDSCILSPDAVYSVQTKFNGIVGTLFIGSTHADCISVISMTVWAALSSQLNLGVFFQQKYSLRQSLSSLPM